MSMNMNIKEMNKAEFLRECGQDVQPLVSERERIERAVFRRVQEAFRLERVQQSDFMGSTGYGYGDMGRDKLGRVFARAMESEDAIVRPHIMSGTHALSIALSATLKPGDTLLSVTGTPYDTIHSVIGITSHPSSLMSSGVSYDEIPLLNDSDGGGIDYASLGDCAARFNSQHDKHGRLMIYAQRSRGYAHRRSLMPDEFATLAEYAHNIDKNIIVMVDNCYGEFVCEHEPTYYGADLMAGSLIKNPGGGLAPSGGYIAGRVDLVEQASQRLSAPGIGREIGSYEPGYRLFYQGLYLAPHIVSQALHNATLLARAFQKLGMAVSPAWDAQRGDIVQSIRLGSLRLVEAFCAAVQASSPVDAFATPLAWDMPGYADKVVMAAGTFVSGSSIEFSADAPAREPYDVYFQGGLTAQQGYIFLENFLGNASLS